VTIKWRDRRRPRSSTPALCHVDTVPGPVTGLACTGTPSGSRAAFAQWGV
jgi:hypothetical protein